MAITPRKTIYIYEHVSVHVSVHADVKQSDLE